MKKGKTKALKKKKGKTKALAKVRKRQMQGQPFFEPEVIEVIRRTVAPDLTPPELKVYLGVCRKYEGDPIMKDIVPVIFNTRKHGRTLNFIITRDFLLKKANRSGVLDGLHSQIVRDAKNKIIGATAECWKKGSSHSFKAEVSFSEYYNDKNDLWGQFPGAMIKKVAEVIVLKQICGIDMPSDVELEKSGGRMIQISDIQIPKTKFTVSDTGKVRTKVIEEPKETKGKKEKETINL